MKSSLASTIFNSRNLRSKRAGLIVFCLAALLAFAPVAQGVEWSDFMSMPLVGPVLSYGQDAPTMEFDANGVWHMGYCYNDGASDHLTYLNALGETYDIVNTASDYLMCPCFAFDPAGNLHVVYRSGGGSIWHTDNTSGAWAEPTMLVAPVPTWSIADPPAFVFDAEGAWHMVYAWSGDSGGHLTYMNSKGEQYDLPYGGYYPSIAFGPTGKLGLVCRGGGGSVWGTYDISKPTEVIVPEVPTWMGAPSAAIDKQGVAHVVYGWASETGYITYVNSLGDTLNIASGDVRCPEICIDPNGALYVICRGAGGSIGKSAAKSSDGAKVCLFRIRGMFSDPAQGQGPHFTSLAPQLSTGCADAFSSLGWSDWMDLDLQGIEAVLGGGKVLAGDGIPDALQLATVEAVLCNENSPRRDLVMTQFLSNKTILRDDLAWLCANVSQDFLPLYADIDLLAMLLGVSEAMQESLDAVVRDIGHGTGGLHRLSEYAVFGLGGSKVDEPAPFSAEGDLDLDGLTNLEEYQQVVDGGASPMTYVQAATDPSNFWDGNPNLDAATLQGLLLLCVLIGAVGLTLANIKAT